MLSELSFSSQINSRDREIKELCEVFDKKKQKTEIEPKCRVERTSLNSDF